MSQPLSELQNYCQFHLFSNGSFDKFPTKCRLSKTLFPDHLRPNFELAPIDGRCYFVTLEHATYIDVRHVSWTSL